MSVTKELFRVPGICYRARLKYRSSAVLDRLATFFYDEVLPHENKVEVLLDLLGLPHAVVEDVIGELIRKGYASLDLPRGTVRRLQPERGDASFKESKNYLEVWQDSLTGAFIPTSCITAYRCEVPPSTAKVFSPDPKHLSPEVPADEEVAEHQRQRSFLEVADDRILSAVRHLDPSITMEADPDAVLDSLSDKERLEPLEIYLPVRDTNVPELDELIEFIYAPQLPHWVVRAWSLAMRAAKSQSPVSEFALASAIRKESESINMFGELDAKQLSQSWHNAFLELVEAKPIPSDDSPQFEAERDLRAGLTERIRTGGRSHLTTRCPENGSTHIAETWKMARSHLLCVLSEWNREILEQIISDSLGVDSDSPGRGESETQLVLIPARRADNARANQLVSEVGGKFHRSGRLLFAKTAESRISRTLCLCDDLELRFLANATSPSSDQAFVIGDENLVREIADRVVQSIPDDDPNRQKLQNLRRSLPRRDDSMVTGISLLSDMVDLDKLLGDTIEKYEIELNHVRNERAQSDNDSDKDESTEEESRRKIDVLSRSCLAQREPRLVSHAIDVRRDLDELDNQSTSVAMVDRQSLLDCLLDAAEIAASAEGSHLQLVINAASSLALRPELIKKLRFVIARKGRVTFHVPSTAEDQVFDAVGEATRLIANPKVIVQRIEEDPIWSIDAQVEGTRFLAFVGLDSETRDAFGIIACMQAQTDETTDQT